MTASEAAAVGRKAKVRAGVIGCGAISVSHLEALRGNASAEIVACADTNPQAARERAAQFDIPFVTTPEELLQREDVDLVLILVPPKWHEPLFMQALQNGKDVLIEKPLAAGMAGAQRMADAAKSSGLIVGVALMHRYLPGYHLMRDLLQGGAIGRVKQVRFSFGHDMAADSRFLQPESNPRAWLVNAEIAGGGILMSSTIHFLSTMSFILGGVPARQVRARTRQLGRKVYPGIEDDVELWIDLKGDIEFVVNESWAADKPLHMEFIGERGFLVLHGENWNDLALSGRCEGPLPPECAAYRREAEIAVPDCGLLNPVKPFFHGLIGDMVQSVQQRQAVPRLPDARHARDMQAVVTAAYRSAREQKSVPID